MSLTTYCSADEIRSVLGVSSIELSDETLLAPLHEASLKMDLERAASGVRVAFLAAVGTIAATTLQSGLMDAVRVFSVYSVARRVGVALGMLAPKDLHDDKSGFSRFSDGPYRDVLARVDVAYAASRGDLKLAYAAWAGATATAIAPAQVFLASSRSYDPVAGV